MHRTRVIIADDHRSFGEALQKYAFDLYTRRTGIKVEIQYANPADFLAKMIASRGREARLGLAP